MWSAGNKILTRGRREDGVTLLELLVVLAILSLALSLVVPRLGRWTDNWKLRSAAQHVAQMLTYAHTRALYEHQIYFVQIHPSENRVRLFGVASGFTREYVLPAGVHLEKEENAAPVSAIDLVFPPSGTVEERTLGLTNGQGSRARIHLNFLLGTPRVEITRRER